MSLIQEKMLSASSRSHHHSAHTHSNNRLQMVTMNLKQLNKHLPRERQIKMLLFIYSRYSSKCKTLVSSMPQELKELFYFISIDNKRIREQIMNSSTIKISEVPSVILIDINDVISVYEGVQTIEIINTISEIYQKMLMMEKKQLQVPPANQTFQSNELSENVTNVLDLIDEPTRSSSTQSSVSKKKVSFKEEAVKGVTDLSNILPNETDMVRQNIRTKVRNAKPSSENFNTPSNIEIHQNAMGEGGITSARVYPKKGTGHNGMAYSSLSTVKDTTDEEDENDFDLEDVNGGEMLDDDIDDIFNGDNTIDPAIKNNISTSKSKVDKKDLMDNVKRVAMEMQKMREENDDE